MKAIMMSIRPQWIAKILNGEKTIEIRKKFPKDYVGWVYIYCTKEQGLARLLNNGSWIDTFKCDKNLTEKDFKRMRSDYDGKGKVVARFWCEKVEEITYYPKKPFDRYGTPYRATYDLLAESCLEYDELDNYLNKNNGYAIQITELEIFDKPKEISEFKPHYGYPTNHRLTRVPQSWQFIEI